MRKIILALLLMGGVELNPGPAKKGQKKNNAKNVKCHLCDKAGSRNSIKMQCGECKQWNHATCLGLTEKEKRKYRQAGYTCYPCSLPAALSDSFLSLEPPPAMNVSLESVELNENDQNKNAPRLLCFNARSLKNSKRGADIAALIQTQSADIIGVNETWLKNDMNDHEFIPRSYMVFRRDRPGKAKDRGGGVLLAVRPHLQPKRVNELEKDATSRTAEIIWVTIKAGN
ncbi:MAG: endonuclease/exonuclease/phosphatase family protein, partial [Aeromonas sp.]